MWLICCNVFDSHFLCVWYFVSDLSFVRTHTLEFERTHLNLIEPERERESARSSEHFKIAKAANIFKWLNAAQHKSKININTAKLSAHSDLFVCIQFYNATCYGYYESVSRIDSQWFHSKLTLIQTKTIFTWTKNPKHRLVHLCLWREAYHFNFWY